MKVSRYWAVPLLAALSAAMSLTLMFAMPPTDNAEHAAASAVVVPHG